MYVIIVYDIGVERVNKVREFLRQYMNWVQNSVFEGELTRSEYIRVVDELRSLIDAETDSILIYWIRDQKWLKKEVLGVEKAPIEEII